MSMILPFSVLHLLKNEAKLNEDQIYVSQVLEKKVGKSPKPKDILWKEKSLLQYFKELEFLVLQLQ